LDYCVETNCTGRTQSMCVTCLTGYLLADGVCLPENVTACDLCPTSNSRLCPNSTTCCGCGSGQGSCVAQCQLKCPITCPQKTCDMCLSQKFKFVLTAPRAADVQIKELAPRHATCNAGQCLLVLPTQHLPKKSSSSISSTVLAPIQVWEFLCKRFR